MLTGIGGGVMCDLLVNEVPVVLRADLYALAGAGIVVAGHLARWPPTAITIAGAILCFSIRFIAIQRRMESAGRGCRFPPGTNVTDART